MTSIKSMIGQRCVIISDNEQYDKWKNKTLILTHASRGGLGYDESVYPELLCDFKTEEGKDFAFALYEYEFQVI